MTHLVMRARHRKYISIPIPTGRELGLIFLLGTIDYLRIVAAIPGQAVAQHSNRPVITAPEHHPKSPE
jgi:hypothetical protein